MKLKCDFEIVEMDNEVIAVPIGDGASQVKGVIKMNKSGQEIFEMFKNDTTEEKIVAVLSNRYEDEIQRISGYVHEVVYTMHKADLIVN